MKKSLKLVITVHDLFYFTSAWKGKRVANNFQFQQTFDKVIINKQRKDYNEKTKKCAEFRQIMFMKNEVFFILGGCKNRYDRCPLHDHVWASKSVTMTISTIFAFYGLQLFLHLNLRKWSKSDFFTLRKGSGKNTFEKIHFFQLLQFGRKYLQNGKR